MAGLYQNEAAPSHKQLYRNSYGSLGGVDIKVVIAGSTVGNIQAISYSITREKAPVYTMGSVEPRGFARGKRGIAGSLVFVMFDMHALLALFRNTKGYGEGIADYAFVTDRDELSPDLPDHGYEFNRSSTVATADPSGGFGLQDQYGVPVVGGNNLNFEGAYTPGHKLETGWVVAPAWYADQIASFNIVLVGVNEDGVASQMGVLGAEILNEGYGVSINDLVSEQQMTYVARAVSAWSGIRHEFFEGYRSPEAIQAQSFLTHSTPGLPKGA